MVAVRRVLHSSTEETEPEDPTRVSLASGGRVDYTGSGLQCCISSAGNHRGADSVFRGLDQHDTRLHRRYDHDKCP